MAITFLNSLYRPYPQEKRFYKRLITSALFGGFVFLFLYVFKPFGLNAFGEKSLLMCAGFGITTFVIMLLLNVSLFLTPFVRIQWIVLHELIWILLNIISVSAANILFYSYYPGVSSFTGKVFFVFVGYTFAVSIFPVLGTIFTKELLLRRHFETTSKSITRELESFHDSKENDLIVITSAQAKDALQLVARNLLFIRAAENYIDIYYLNGKTIEKKLLRHSIGVVAEQLESTDKAFFRCHKSYIVNLAHVKQVSGNAQGYKLSLSHTDELIPVSRQHNTTLRERIAIAP